MPGHQLTLVLVAGLLGCGAAQRVDDHPSLDWLVGGWVGEVDGQQVEERWTPIAGRSMLGVGRTVAHGETTSFEYLRVEWRDDTIYYLASPQGRDPPTVFALGAISADAVTFENAKHDFPQRIRYQREGDALHVEISGGGQVLRWTLRRADR